MERCRAIECRVSLVCIVRAIQLPGVCSNTRWHAVAACRPCGCSVQCYLVTVSVKSSASLGVFRLLQICAGCLSVSCFGVLCCLSALVPWSSCFFGGLDLLRVVPSFVLPRYWAPPSLCPVPSSYVLRPCSSVSVFLFLARLFLVFSLLCLGVQTIAFLDV